VREPETDALRRALEGPVARVSSALLGVELHCLAQRLPAADHERIRLVLARIDTVPPTGAILSRASAPFDPPQRALDAVHLATALALDIDGLALVSYDQQQIAAAQAVGLTVLTPS
jgi:predicted nucleic acid-binding protein